MSTSPLEQDFTSNNNSSRLDQKPPAPNYSSTSQNASSFDFMNKVPQSTFERGSLKNLSNDELEKLIQQKTQSIEKIQATNNNLSSSMTRTTGLSLASPSRKVGNQNVNQILSKYNLTPSNEDKGSSEYRPVENKPNESHIAQTTDPATGGDTPGFPSAFLHTGGFDSHKKEVLRETNLAINTTDNPYLSNLESSIERIEQPQTRTSKDIDVFLFNQEFGTSRDYQLGSPVMGNSPLRLSGKPQSKENIPKAFNLGQMTPKQSALPKPAKGSPAIAGAMKALQDKLENAEAEINELKKKLNDAGNEKHRELEEQKKKIFRELESREQREDELLRKVENLNTQNFQLQNELTRIKLTNQTNEEQLQSVKAELIKLKDETRNLQQENGVIKKEVMLVENEKNFHIEQNANDRDSYERRIEELAAELDEEREKRAQLEKYKEEAENFRAEAEDELHRITNELSSLGKHNKEKIKTLEHQLDEALKQNQAYVEEFSTAMGKSEKEKISLQKKVDDFDRRIEAIVTSYEDKIDAYKEENNDFKKLTNSQQKELVSLKKRVVQLDQENAKLESYKSEKDKVIKQLLEIADDLARKIKKDPNDTILQNILFKKKKIEQEVQSKNRERSAAKKKTPGSGKKSYSRSPSAKKSARKEVLSVEDLNLSRDSATGVTPRSSNRKRKMSGSQGHRMPSQPSPLRDSKMSIPLKGSVGHDNPPKPQRSSSNTGRTQSKRDKPSPKRKDSLTKNTPLNIRTYTTEDPVTSYNFVGILGVPSTAPNEAGKKLLGSVSSNEMSYASKLESSNLQSNRPVKLNFDIEKMSSNQISAEIVKIEREISELKREYKNLLAKAQNTEAGDVQEVKDRLTQVANELQEKSEAHLLIKKKQRELLSKNM